MPKTLPAFEAFIADMRAIWSQESDTLLRMELSRDRLEVLVRDPALQEHSQSWPSTEGRKNLLLLLVDAPSDESLDGLLEKKPAVQFRASAKRGYLACGNV